MPNLMTARGWSTNFLRTTLHGLCALALWLCSPGPVAAEHSATWFVEDFRHRPDTRFGVINALALAADGHLWVGTSSGLFRFDGAQFLPWGARGEPPLPLHNIRALLPTKDGCLWVGFSESGITTICNDHVRNFSLGDGISDGYVNTIIETRDGAVWSGGRGGLARYYKGQWDRAPGRGLPAAIVYSLYEDRRGWLWVGTSTGIFLRKPDSTAFEHFSSDTVRAFGEDAAGTLWATDPQRLAQTLYPVKSGSPEGTRAIGMCLYNDRFGGMWIGTMGQGLFRVDRPENQKPLRISRVADQADESDDAVLAIVADTDGNIWVATRTGLQRYFEHGATMITRQNGLTNNTVRVVQTAGDGQMWVGTVEGIDVFNSADPRRAIDHHTMLGPVTAMHAGRAGQMWVSTDFRIGTFADGRFSPIPRSVAPMHVYVIAAHADGTAWVCHSGAATLSRSDGRTLWPVVDPAIPPQRCMDIAVDPQGRVWIAFTGGHIRVYEHGKFWSLGTADGLPSAPLHTLYADRHGTVWVGTAEGLSRIRGRQIDTFTQANGLPGRYVSAIVEDDFDHLWFIIDSRIIRVAHGEFDRAAADAAYRIGYRSFDRSEGVLEGSFPFGSPMVAKDEHGKLWFQTAAGVAVIDPRHVRPRTAGIRAQIERVVLNGTPVWPTPSHVQVPSGTSSIEIDYTAVSLSNASKLTFEYRLDGFDTEWIDAGVRRQAFYTDLPPDSYTFRVRASLEGVRTAETTWEMTIAPAFYQQPWFRALVLIAIAAAAWAAWALRVRNLRTQFRLVLNERTRIGREVHDTLLQSLAGMAMQMESLARQIQFAPESVSEDLRRMRRQAQQHVREARELIWDLRRPGLTSFALVDALQDFVRTEVEPHVMCHVDLIGHRRPLTPETEWELFRIAQEALRNSVRHSRARLIDVRLEYRRAAFSMRIVDDGPGFDVDAVTAAQGGRWGLVGMQERARKVGAQFSITSSPQGTEVVVDLPYIDEAVSVA